MRYLHKTVKMNTSPIRKNRSGSIIHSGERRIIYNVFKYFKMCDLNVTMESTVIQTASTCGVSENTVYKIIREQKETNTLKSPVRKRARLSMIDKLDESQKCAIRRKVQSIYLNNDYPTLDKIMALCEADEDIPNFKRTTLSKILHEIGFDFKQRDSDASLPTAAIHRGENRGESASSDCSITKWKRSKRNEIANKTAKRKSSSKISKRSRFQPKVGEKHSLHFEPTCYRDGFSRHVLHFYTIPTLFRNKTIAVEGRSSQSADDSSLEDEEEELCSDMEELINEEREEAIHMAQEYLEWEERKKMAEVNKASETWRANQLKKTTDSSTKATSKKRKLDPEINATEESCGFECSECPKQLTGKLSWCIQCAVLLCTVCERSHAAHYVLRAPPNRPPGELEQVMASIRPVVEHIVESTAAPQTSIEVNADPLLVPKEEPDDEEISMEIEETPTHFIYPNIVTYQPLGSKHTVTSATLASEPATSTEANSTPSQVPPSTSTLKSKRALSKRVKPKKSVEITLEKPPTVSGLKNQTFQIAPSSSISETESVETNTSTSGFSEIPLETSGVIKDVIGDVGAEAVQIKEEEDPGVSEFLVFSHGVKKESDPS